MLFNGPWPGAMLARALLTLETFPLLVIPPPRYLSMIASLSIPLDFELVAIAIWPQFLCQLTSDFCIAYRSLAPLTSLHRSEVQ